MDSRSIKVLVVFILFYAILFVLSNFLGPVLNVKAWAFTSLDRLDYMLWFVPIAGFFFVYMLIPYLRSELGFGGFFVKVLPIVFAVAAYFAYYVAVFWYFDNVAFLNKVPISQLNLPFLDPFGKGFFDLFLNSHFFYFVLAGVGGWAARLLIEKFDEYREGK